MARYVWVVESREGRRSWKQESYHRVKKKAEDFLRTFSWWHPTLDFQITKYTPAPPEPNV